MHDFCIENVYGGETKQLRPTLIWHQFKAWWAMVIPHLTTMCWLHSQAQFTLHVKIPNFTKRCVISKILFSLHIHNKQRQEKTRDNRTCIWGSQQLLSAKACKEILTGQRIWGCVPSELESCSNIYIGPKFKKTNKQTNNKTPNPTHIMWGDTQVKNWMHVY